MPADKIVSVLEAVARRTPTKINSFKYFVKEIIAPPDPRNRAWQKKRLEKIVNKVRDISVGRAGYSMADFVEDVKRTAPAKASCSITIFSTNWSVETCFRQLLAVLALVFANTR